jgi:ribosome biogenesis GTPase / thiamine phosphate phosphatase
MKQGVVIKSTGSWYQVRTDDGTLYECRIKGKFRISGIKSTNPVAVGDRVDFSINDEDNTGVIQELHPRKNYIIRKSTKLSKQTHILASNLDQAVLIVTLISPKTYTAFIDRFLVTAEAYHIPAILIFNKVDLYATEELKEMNYLIKAYREIGYPCHSGSLMDSNFCEEIKSIFKDKVTLLSGHSGVGKSTLVNTIDASLNLKVSEISDYHKSGKHTTTFAEMHPLAIGGYVIDTPGIKGFGVVDMEKEELAHRFPDMRKYIGMCKFHNCQHINEPDCAVKEALDNGEIYEFRYLNYLDLYYDEDDTYRTPGY